MNLPQSPKLKQEVGRSDIEHAEDIPCTARSRKGSVLQRAPSELGDSSQKKMMAWGIDRYLVNSNHKQLFGSQLYKLDIDPCWCVEPIEKSFPDSLRKSYEGHTLSEIFAGVDKMNEGASCPHANVCKHDFKNSPAGTVPGFW